MKWLFFLMLAVNIAIFIWGVQREAAAPAHQDPRYRSIGDIRLLTGAEIESYSTEPVLETAVSVETVTGSARQAVLTETDSTALADTRKMEGESEGRPDIRAEDDPVMAPAPVEDSTTSEESSFTEMADQEPESGAEKSVVDPQAVPVVESSAVDPVWSEADLPAAEEANKPVEAEDSLITASNEATQTIPPDPVETLPNPRIETVAAPELFCHTLGPISERTVALTILETIEEKVTSAELKEEMLDKVTGYWVVLPPYESASAANRAVEELKTRGVVDVQRFYRGELKNGVSLGVYNRRFNADKRREQIVAKGFSPHVIPRSRQVASYWIDYSSENEISLLAELPPEHRDLTILERACGDQPNGAPASTK